MNSFKCGGSPTMVYRSMFKRFAKCHFAKLVNCLVAVLFLSICYGCEDTSPALHKGDVFMRGPITIAASCVGRFQEHYSWYFSINSAGDGVVTIETLPLDVTKRVTVDDKKMLEFKRLLHREKFFEMDRKYGNGVPDTATILVAITVGDMSNSVTLEHLDRGDIKSAEGIIAIHNELRSWFDDERATDHSVYLNGLIDAK